ncbi:hypothetical protein SZ55_4934 [Pseudomonas sp. FeS53a]|nr:hypothetical protein SZ55_4934 [Pseudomonas sp. FeS53a]
MGGPSTGCAHGLRPVLARCRHSTRVKTKNLGDASGSPSARGRLLAGVPGLEHAVYFRAIFTPNPMRAGSWSGAS